MKEDCRVRYWEQDCECDALATYGLPCARRSSARTVLTDPLTTLTIQEPPPGPRCLKCGRPWKLVHRLDTERLILD